MHQKKRKFDFYPVYIIVEEKKVESLYLRRKEEF